MPRNRSIRDRIIGLFSDERTPASTVQHEEERARIRNQIGNELQALMYRSWQDSVAPAPSVTATDAVRAYAQVLNPRYGIDYSELYRSYDQLILSYGFPSAPEVKNSTVVTYIRNRKGLRKVV